MPLLLSKQIGVWTKYADFADLFSKLSEVIVLEKIGINEHIINVIDRKQPPFGSINSLTPIELETLKSYIKTDFANSFIQTSKPLVKTLIFIV